jgi:hypothetical protein
MLERAGAVRPGPSARRQIQGAGGATGFGEATVGHASERRLCGQAVQCRRLQSVRRSPDRLHYHIIITFINTLLTVYFYNIITCIVTH